MENQTDMKNILIKASKLLQTAESMQRKIDEIKKKYRPTEGGYKQLWHGVKPIGMKLLIVFVCLILFEILGGVFEWLAQIFFERFGFSVNFSLGLIGVIQVMLVVLTLVFSQEFANKKIIIFNQKNANRLEQNKINNQNLKQEEMALRDQLNAVAIQYTAECSDYIPQDYRYDAEAVDFFAKAMVNQRADNIKEAVNLYETELYRRRMEAKQDELIRKQEEANQLAAANLAASIAAAEAANRQADAAYSQAAAMNRQADELSRIRNGY